MEWGNLGELERAFEIEICRIIAASVDPQLWVYQVYSGICICFLLCWLLSRLPSCNLGGDSGGGGDPILNFTC